MARRIGGATCAWRLTERTSSSGPDAEKVLGVWYKDFEGTGYVEEAQEVCTVVGSTPSRLANLLGNPSIMRQASSCSEKDFSRGKGNVAGNINNARHVSNSRFRIPQLPVGERARIYPLICSATSRYKSLRRVGAFGYGLHWCPA